ncbi:MAG: hypothetical protein H7Z14_09205 [Anaerolineae bacterium]|nr:hypothetical protein [Phycisphaerae bacterium]
MVLLLFIYTILNASVSSAGFQNIYRVEIAGVPVGIMEAMLILGFTVAIFVGGSHKPTNDPVDRTHPVFVICMLCLVIGQLMGMLGMFFHDAALRWKLIFSREFFGMLAAVYTGYRLIPSMKAASKIPYAFIFAGIGTAIFLLTAFARGSERYALHGDTNALRTVQFVTVYAGVACALLLYSVLSGTRLFPTPIALVLAGFCFIGQLAPLHRSDWVAQVAAIGAVPLGLRPGQRIRQGFRLILAAIALVLSLWIGLHVASAATGRNFHKTFEDRVISLLPSERLKQSDQKAWDTRLPAIQVELEMWLVNPLMGRGFGAQESTGLDSAVGFGFHHNAYSSTLVQVGIIGFLGVVLAVWSPVFVGMKLVRAGNDRASVLIGGLGIVAGVQQGVLGMATASFNGYRMAMMIGLISGMCFKVRDMQLTALRLNAEYGFMPGYDGTGGAFPVINDALAIPDFDDYGRPVGHSYN